MAASIFGVFDEVTQNKIISSKVLVVGAGGIGCELLKNLVLSGFPDIEIIDLDTIDVSNLNRQFLFRKEHVGKSKAQVAKESALHFNPDAKITAYHDSIMSSDYDLEFFKKFDLVMNALDNRVARNHVNRMCLAADKPLIESGTAGYLGQVSVIKKTVTECYECQPQAAQKTFPGCTIRNTPSEPIHCIVWAKHLFNQLFGEDDPDQDVSPDTADPELAGEAGKAALESEAKADAAGGIKRKSTQAWAMETGYNAEKLFNKFFRDDIKYLLSMEALWKKRKPPVPLDWNNLPQDVPATTHQVAICDQRLWSVQECADVFAKSLSSLKEELIKQGEGGMLVWDKDDDPAMDFVTSAANIRAHIFGIPSKTRFDVKSMAGNIIPAIATTNAIIAGLIVMEGLKVLREEFDKCKAVFLNRQPNSRKKLLVPCQLEKPNPKCYVCAPKPEVTVILNTHKITVKVLEEKIIKGGLGMVAPDVEIDDGKGTILISSEEGETEENTEKFLEQFGINNGVRLKCDDFLQNYNLTIIIYHRDKLEEDKEFQIIGDVSEIQAKYLEDKENEDKQPNGLTEKQATEAATAVEDEDEVMLVEEEEIQQITVSKKRKHDEEPEVVNGDTVKKQRLISDVAEHYDDIIS
ncbi:hypothetical protein ACJMK2_009174 [Sinanodonta woodiana]|uniref:SUMO-activating enzyme subunit n=1 Tax=Sinanodonta woodiana TaxID=1069815 RepID=A0ABD3VEI5_SINWO